MWGLLFIRRKRRAERESGRERKRKKKDGKVVYYISVRKCVLLESEILLATKRFKDIKLHYKAARPHIH